MRVFLATALFACVATTAAADQFIDPNGRIAFETPAGWLVGPQRAEGYSYIVTAGQNDECHVAAVPRTETADTPPDLLRIGSQQRIDADTWRGVARAMSNLVHGDVTVEEQSVDQTSFWPIQRAELTTSTGQRVFGAIQYRPGVELWTLCSSYNAASSNAAGYDGLFRSVATPNDTSLRTEAERLAEYRTRDRPEEMIGEAQRLYRQGQAAALRRGPNE